MRARAVFAVWGAGFEGGGRMRLRGWMGGRCDLGEGRRWDGGDGGCGGKNWGENGWRGFGGRDRSTSVRHWIGKAHVDDGPLVRSFEPAGLLEFGTGKVVESVKGTAAG